MRDYKINGKTVPRQVWHEHLLTGNWHSVNIQDSAPMKEFVAPASDRVITPEEARRIRESYRLPSTQNETNS
jgi:hypothetical protein